MIKMAAGCFSNCWLRVTFRNKPIQRFEKIFPNKTSHKVLPIISNFFKTFIGSIDRSHFEINSRIQLHNNY